MNTIAKVITGVTITASLGAGVYFYTTNPGVKEAVGSFVAPLFGFDMQESAKSVHNACFMIIDGSGSGRSSFAVPQVDTTYVKQVLDKIRKNGTGELWLTYIDASALNNEVLYFAIPEKRVAPVQPERQGGESMRAFSERTQAYEKDLEKYRAEAPEAEKQYESELRQFLQKCQGMISEAYAPKAKHEDFSDVTGSVNAALRTFGTVDADLVHHRTVLVISDGMQSLPAGVKSASLGDIPEDINIVLCNAGGSPDHVLNGRVLEVESLARALTQAIHENKPSKTQ